MSVHMIAIILLLVVVVVLLYGGWALLIVAGRADADAERMWRERK